MFLMYLNVINAGWTFHMLCNRLLAMIMSKSFKVCELCDRSKLSEKKLTYF